MLKQYQELKAKYPDCLLFFRLGDFYELFCEDAHIGARVLDITLTARPGGRDGRVPMAGVPYHAADSYLSKLVKAGYKVAICEQVSEPNKHGLVDREVVRIVTPGTVLDERALEHNENNFIISLTLDTRMVALAAADISTGLFQVTEFSVDQWETDIKNELARLHPVECILPDNLYNTPELLKLITEVSHVNVYPFAHWEIYAKSAKSYLKKNLHVATLESFQLEESPLLIEVAATLMGYLEETQQHALSHITTIKKTSNADYVVLDRSTMANLEIFTSLRGESKGSLISILDHTKTAMGSRLLKQWVKYPLTQKEAIDARLDAVEEWTHQKPIREEIKAILNDTTDIERLVSRLAVGLGNARDLVNLKLSLERIMVIKDSLQSLQTRVNQQVKADISSQLNSLIHIINRTIIDEPSIETKQGGMIRAGINQELDELRGAIGDSKAWLANLEQIEREKTGIASLKVRSNKVFGFYIEVSKANLHLVPQEYSRKQTLVNAERFVTTQLKVQEDRVMTAEEQIHALEYKLFLEVVATVVGQLSLLQQAAVAIATLDCVTTFATISEHFNYTRPKLIYSGEIKITAGRHPVVERILEEHAFVPNDVVLDNISQPLLLITGPNMAGKSVLIRQVAIIVLMTHIGCFVPASEAHVSLVDQIFVRSGASDAIGAGLSTFMVEMVETAHILNTMTRKSLIVMDEIGRGTSTYDGISIAWAVAEYIVTHDKHAPKTLFATHYHELQALADSFPQKIKNFHMAVVEEQGTPVFLYTLLSGPASHSFGVAVAKLAGVPETVITTATTLLHSLENRSKPVQNRTPVEPITEGISQKLKQLDLSNMTPLQALNTLAQLQSDIKKE